MERAANSPGPGDWRWRWRASPLRRRSDLVEAWVLLTAALLMTLGAAVAGMVTFHTALDMAEQQRADRHQITAELTEDARHHRSDALYAVPNAQQDWARVQWSAPDGTEREGSARVAQDRQAGSTVTIWTDGTGQQVVEPPGAVVGVLQSALWGVLAAGAMVAVALALCRAVRAVLNRQRAARWERAWAEIEPHWRRKTP